MDINLPRRSSRKGAKPIAKSKLESNNEAKTERKSNSSRITEKSLIIEEKDGEIQSEKPQSTTSPSRNVVNRDTTTNKKVMVTLFKMNLDMFGDPFKEGKNLKEPSTMAKDAQLPSTLTKNSTSNSHHESPEVETIDKIRNEINSYADLLGQDRFKSITITKIPSKVPGVSSPKNISEPQNNSPYNKKEISKYISPVKVGKTSPKGINKATNSKHLAQSSKQNQSVPLLKSQGPNFQSSSSLINFNQPNISSPIVQSQTPLSKTANSNIVHTKYIPKTPIKSSMNGFISKVGNSGSSSLKRPNNTKSNKTRAVRFGDEITPILVELDSDTATPGKLSGTTQEKEEIKKSPKRKGANKEQQQIYEVEVCSTSSSAVLSKQTPRKKMKVSGKSPTKSKTQINIVDDSWDNDNEPLATLIKKVHDKEEKEESCSKRTSLDDKGMKTTKRRGRSQSPRKKGSNSKVKVQQTPKKLNKQNQQNNNEKVISEESLGKKEKSNQHKNKLKQEPKAKRKRNSIKTESPTKNDIYNYDSDVSITDGNMPVIKDSVTPNLKLKCELQNSPSHTLEAKQQQKPPQPQKKTRGRRKLDENGRKTKKKRGRKKIKKQVVEEAVNLEKPWGTEDEEDEEEDEEYAGDEQGRKMRKRNQRRTGRRFSVTGNWYIASGYLNDIISLLEDFESIEGWRFQDFAKCWKKKKFSLVYRGRQTFKELLEFSEEMALLTKRFLNPPHSMKRRIGALYTLYGLYYKFPLGKLRFFHLRFEYGEYEDLLALIFPFRSNIENPDPAYIFRKLELDGAILHCATAIEPCYDFHNEERDHVELEYGKERLAKSSAVLNAVPKIQLQADLNLLQHYHSVKAKVAGQDVPEKALSMITPEFLVGISTNLNALRHNTLQELGMSGESANILKSENLIEAAANIEEQDMDTELELYSVDQSVIDTVNKGSAGQRSQNALRNNQIVSNQEVKEFMRPPTADDLCQPLMLCQSEEIKEQKDEKITKEDVTKPSQNKQPGEFLWEFEGKLDLDVQEKPRQEYSDVTDVLLPQPLPVKKQRRSKRPAALIMDAYLSPRNQKRAKKEPVFAKSLSPTESKENDAEDVSKLNLHQHNSATRLLVSELPDIKAKNSDTMIVLKVRIKAGDVGKTVKVKLRKSPEQLDKIMKNPMSLNKFKNQLKPLIKATQKGKDKIKDWCVVDILLHEEETDKQASTPPTNTTTTTTTTIITKTTTINNKNKDASSDSAKKMVPFKKKYECLKYSDDEDENKDGFDEDDDEMFQCKWKTEEEKDFEYCPPEEEPEEEPLEYQDDGFDDDYDDDYIPETKYFWRKKRQSKSYYYGNYFEEKGPRDSDQLLKARNTNSISMVPMQVGGKIKYFPMIQTQGNTPSKDSKERRLEEEEKKDLEVEELPKDPNEEKAIFTWNDFSSDKSPPFKKRRSNNAFSYIFSPKLPLKNEQDQKPVLRKILSSTVIKEAPKIISSQNENVKEENIESDNYESDDDSIDIKAEKTTIEELAGEWDDDEESPFPKVVSHDPLDIRSKDEVLIKERVHDVNEVYIEETEIYPIDDADIVDATDFQDDSDHGELGDKIEGVLSNSFIDEAARKVSQILPDISLTNDYENDYYSNNDNRAGGLVSVCDQSSIPGNIFMADCSAGTSLGQQEHQSHVQTFSDANIVNYSSGFDIHEADSVEKQTPLYYKMAMSDGNSIFVPVSSLPKGPVKDVKILSFNVADVKPLISATDSYHDVSGQSYLNGPSSSNPQEQVCSPSSTINTLYLNNSSSINNNIDESVFAEQNSTLPLPNTSLRSEGSTRPTCSFSFSNKHTPNTNSTQTVKNLLSRPSCSFLFSKKLQKTFKNFPSAKGEAKGKVYSPEKPKVKFLMKGMFSKFAKKV